MAAEKLSVTGHVVHIGETTVITDKFQKRDLYIETRENPNYPETIAFEAHQDRCDLLDPFKFGDEVRVWFNLKGRAYTSKTGKEGVFNTLQAWRFEKLNAAAAATKANSPAIQETQGQAMDTKPGDDDDLPF